MSLSIDQPSIQRAKFCESGSASVEFLVLGVGLLVPLVYLVLALGSVQHAWMGAESAARAVAQAVSDSRDETEAARRVALALHDAGFPHEGEDAAAVSVECLPASSSCFRPRTVVVAHVSIPVALPGIGTVSVPGNGVRVEASASHEVPRFSQRPEG